MSFLNKPIFDEQVFDNFFNPKTKKNYLKCDIYEDEQTVFIEVDSVTNKKEEISINYENNNLIIEITKNIENKEGNIQYVRKERVYNEYIREIYVGNIDFNKTHASLKNGTLIISFPKDNSGFSKIKID